MQDMQNISSLIFYLFFFNDRTFSNPLNALDVNCAQCDLTLKPKRID